jgi:predicted acylesterase/phospholipase RssA
MTSSPAAASCCRAAGARPVALGIGRKSLTQALEATGRQPAHRVFSNQQVHAHLARLFAQNGFTNDFPQLKTQLTLVATNLDTGEAAPFGRPGWDHVPISQAVQASAALPGPVSAGRDRRPVLRGRRAQENHARLGGA